ncbi:MAG: hypothetical protein ABJV04_16215, partial [Aliiglaciecola sp.]|uniref:hypothetical protein n=1 Tax=Aliiglaciecola sp. TaxID=1872441 RepID=UPI00329961C6
DSHILDLATQRSEKLLEKKLLDSHKTESVDSHRETESADLLDSHKLGLAKQPTDIKKESSNWRQWQWPASIAASVMFISLVVYTQYEQFDPRLDQAPQAAVDTYGIAEQATLDESQRARKSKLQTKELGESLVASRMASEPLPEKDEFTEQLMDEPERAQYAEKEALTLAAKAMDNVEIEPLTLDLELPLEVDVEQQIPADIALNQEDAEQQAYEKANLLAKQKVEQSAKRESQAQRRLSLIDVAGKSSDTQNSNSMTQVNTEYLDSLLKKLEEQSGSTNQNHDKKQMVSQLQTDIYDYLSLLRMSDPLLEIEKKYWQVLTDEQQQKLGK